jgi:hypothetical protein
VAKKVISFGWSDGEIDSAIKQLNSYKQEMERKLETLRKKVAEKISNYSQSGFASAIVDDLLNGTHKTADVKVSVEDRGNVSVVIAAGEDAVWVEFGAGVYHNGSAGSSPHPSGAELGFTIGSYGKGMGSRKVWGFYENGELQLTHGTPATMPMYKAARTVCAEIASIAREVWK